MTVQSSTISLIEFAKAIREAGGSFDQSVSHYESCFGAVDDDILAVLAQAAFLCWVNVEAERNLLAACEAIRTGKPTYQYYHCQITPDRWIEMHSYLIGIQRWLGVEQPLPPQIDVSKVEQIAGWLGEPSPAKVALAELLLIRLVDDLLNYLSLGMLGNTPAADRSEYPGFSAWYSSADGTPLAVARTGDSSRRPFAGPPFKGRADQLAAIVHAHVPSRPDDAAELIDWVTRQTQPPCMHRFSRYLDLQIASIGALKLRGSPPPDATPKAVWQAWRQHAQDALLAWAGGAQPGDERARHIHAILGEPTEPKRAIVRDFLLGGFHDTGDTAGWDWLVIGAQTKGTNAHARFQLEGAFDNAPTP